MEDDQDNPYAQFGYADTPQTAPVAPARPTLTVRPLGTGTKAPTPQTQTQAAIDVQDLENKKLTGQKLAMDAANPSSEAQQANRRKAALESIVGQINNVQDLYNKNIYDGGIDRMFAGIIGAFPTSENKEFDSASAALAEQGLSAFRVPGVGSQSDTELRQFVEANRPQAGDYNASIEQKLKGLRARIDTERQSLGMAPAQWSGLPVVQGERREIAAPISPNIGSQPPPVPASGPSSPAGGPDVDRSSKLYVEDTSPGEAQITTAPIKYATEADKRVGAVLQTVLDRGGSVDEANQVLSQYGYTSPIGAESWNDALKYNRTRPKGAAKARVAPPETGVREISDYQKAVGNFASSALGAGTIGVLNGLSAGTIDEIGGGIDAIVNDKPFDQAIAEANLKKGLVQQANPTAYTVGEVAGGVAGSLGTGRVIGGGVRGATSAFAPRALAGDAAFGAAYGAGENNEDRATGAAIGALTSAGGGALGRGVARGVAGAIAPAVSPAIRTLRDRGVRLSLGQAIGPKAAQFEEKLGSIPVIGGMVRNVRERSIGDFNKAVVDDALAPIGKALPEGATGTAAIRYADDAFKDAYDAAKSRMSLRPDGQMVADLQGLEQRVIGGQLDDESAKRLRKIYDAQVARKLNPGGVSGSTYKEIDSALGKLRRGSFQSNRELSDAIGELQDILADTARRSSPADAVEALNKADEGYALFVRAQEAAKMRAGETANFTPLQYDSAVQRADLTTRNRAYLRGEARGQELAEAGKKVLRDRIPNSGTTDRLLAAGAVGGAGYLSPAALAGLSGVAAAYAPGIRTALPAALTRNASPAAQAVANAIRNRGRLIGSATASPMLLAYSPDR